MNDLLGNLSPRARDLSTALRDDPELACASSRRSTRAGRGVPFARRLQMRTIASQTTMR